MACGYQTPCPTPAPSPLTSLPSHSIISPMLTELELYDRVRLRKPHPCGSYEWIVVRLGADIGLECTGCKRRILLSRRELARRLKTIFPRSTDEPSVKP
jgi:hypothetical protein